MKKLAVFSILALIGFVSCVSNPHATSLKIYQQQQNFSKMLSEAQKWVEEEPNNPEAYLWLSRAYTLNRDYTKGAENLFIALEKGLTKPLNDLDRTTLFNAGVLAAQNKNYEFAIKCYKKLKEIEPENPRVYMNLAAFYQSLGKRNEAKKILEEGYQRIPDNSDMVYFYLRFEIEENPDKAEKLAKEQIQKDIPSKTKAKFYSLLGEIYTKKEKHESAFENFKKAYENDTTELNYLFNTALSAFFAKKYENSVEYFKKYIAKNPEDAAGYEYAGRAYHLMKDYKNALNYYNKALEIKEDPMVYKLKADCLSRLGKTKEALEAFKKAEELEKKK